MGRPPLELDCNCICSGFVPPTTSTTLPPPPKYYCYKTLCPCEIICNQNPPTCNVGAGDLIFIGGPYDSCEECQYGTTNTPPLLGRCCYQELNSSEYSCIDEISENECNNLWGVTNRYWDGGRSCPCNNNPTTTTTTTCAPYDILNPIGCCRLCSGNTTVTFTATEEACYNIGGIFFNAPNYPYSTAPCDAPDCTFNSFLECDKVCDGDVLCCGCAFNINSGKYETFTQIASDCSECPEGTINCHKIKGLSVDLVIELATECQKFIKPNCPPTTTTTTTTGGPTTTVGPTTTTTTTTTTAAPLYRCCGCNPVIDVIVENCEDCPEGTICQSALAACGLCGPTTTTTTLSPTTTTTTTVTTPAPTTTTTTTTTVTTPSPTTTTTTTLGPTTTTTTTTTTTLPPTTTTTTTTETSGAPTFDPGGGL